MKLSTILSWIIKIVLNVFYFDRESGKNMWVMKWFNSTCKLEIPANEREWKGFECKGTY
jgi:hypothetical protein